MELNQELRSGSFFSQRRKGGKTQRFVLVIEINGRKTEMVGRKTEAVGSRIETVGRQTETVGSQTEADGSHTETTVIAWF